MPLVFELDVFSFICSPIMTNNSTVSPSEVGWQFVPQYYTVVNKHPSRLHCFYNKASTFIHGTEGEDGKPCLGQAVSAAAFYSCVPPSSEEMSSLVHLLSSTPFCGPTSSVHRTPVATGRVACVLLDARFSRLEAGDLFADASLSGNSQQDHVHWLPRLQGLHPLGRCSVLCKWRYHHPGHRRDVEQG